MVRKPPIRITSNDKAEYQRLVKNARAKIRRVQKNYGIDLTDEIQIPSLEDFNFRSELNATKQRLSSFTNRNNLTYQYKKNEYNFVASKREIFKVEEETRRAIAKAKEEKKRVEELPFTSGGREQGTVGKQAGQLKEGRYTGITIPGEFDFSNVKTRSQMMQKYEAMKKRNRDDYYDNKRSQLLENFITKLEISFPDSDLVAEIEEKLNSMDISDFYDMYQIMDEFDINEYSSENELGEEEEGKIEALNDAIERYVRDYMNQNDLKDF